MPPPNTPFWAIDEKFKDPQPDQLDIQSVEKIEEIDSPWEFDYGTGEEVEQEEN